MTAAPAAYLPRIGMPLRPCWRQSKMDCLTRRADSLTSAVAARAVLEVFVAAPVVAAGRCADVG